LRGRDPRLSLELAYSRRQCGAGSSPALATRRYLGVWRYTRLIQASHVLQVGPLISGFGGTRPLRAQSERILQEAITAAKLCQSATDLAGQSNNCFVFTSFVRAGPNPWFDRGRRDGRYRRDFASGARIAGEPSLVPRPIRRPQRSPPSSIHGRLRCADHSPATPTDWWAGKSTGSTRRSIAADVRPPHTHLPVSTLMIHS
jgi:hypothetical protein